MNNRIYNWIFSATAAVALAATVNGQTPVSVQVYNIPAGLSTYTVPAGVTCITLQMWGAGGGGSATSVGGAGGYFKGTYAVVAGQIVYLMPAGGGRSAVGGGGGSGYAGNGGGSGGTGDYNGAGGGGASEFVLRSTSMNSGLYLTADVIVAGGGGAGAASGADGGAAGVLQGNNGGGGLSSYSGGLGAQVDSRGYDYGANVGMGGSGDDKNGSDGIAGVFDNGWYSMLYVPKPGAGGNGGSSSGTLTGPCYAGGGGGAGWAGGGGGGSGNQSGGGGAGGCAEFDIQGGQPVSYVLLPGTGRTPAGTSDPYYPGNNIGYGGPINSDGGNGAIVLVAYNAAAPVITSATTQTWAQYQPITYSITTNTSIGSYSASGLPPGLSLNTVTGVISGSCPTPGTYSSTVSATNVLGTANATVTWTITADTTPPTVPGNLQASGIGTTGFTLTWTGSTDVGGVTGYQVQGNGILFGSPSATSLAVTGLLAGTTYSTVVRARDTAGNWSAWSTPLNVTTAVPPMSTTVVPASIAARSVTLQWAPYTDSLAIAGYNVLRNGQVVATTKDTAYTDFGLSPSTSYTYTVQPVSSSGSAVGTALTTSVTTVAAGAGDADGDGIPDSTETVLGTSTSSAAVQDSSNQLQLNIQRPTR